MNRQQVWTLVAALLLGQLLSFCIAIRSFVSSYLATLGVDTPLVQSFFSYVSLALVYGAIFLYRGEKLVVPWYWYIVLAITDVSGNYLVVKAYQYSSITSVTLLDCCCIPWVIILTYFLLRTQYTLWQFLGAAICVIGLGLVLLSDSGASAGGGKNPFLGDVLVIIGTICYAFSNVGEELCVKKKDLLEMLTMLGFFGTLVSACEISIFEWKALESIKWTPTMISLFAAFALSAFLFYSVLPFLLKMSGSTMFNLSLLTSDLWAVVIRIFFYHQEVNWLYYLAYGVVAIGLILYAANESSSATEAAIEDEEKVPLTEEENSQTEIHKVSAAD